MWFKVTKALLFSATVVFLLIIVIRFFDEVRTYNFSIHKTYFLLTLLLTILGQHLGALAWCILAQTHSLSPNLSQNLFAWFASRLGRYVPGKTVWFLNRLAIYSSLKAVGLASIVEIAVNLSAVILILFIYSVLNVHSIARGHLVELSILSLPVLFLLITPKVVLKIFMGKKLSRLQYLIENSTVLKAVLLINIVAILVHSLSIYMLIGSVSGYVHGDFGVVLVAYYLAGLLGIFAFFAPAGLGVREGALIFLLKDFYNIEIVIVVTILIRLLGIFSEVISTVFWKKISSRL